MEYNGSNSNVEESLQGLKRYDQLIILFEIILALSAAFAHIY